jgi:hypothetical protein
MVDLRLQSLLDSMTEPIDVSSGVIFIVDPTGGLEPVARMGLTDETLAGLVAAVKNPAHPIAKTAADGLAAYDVTPMAPGGPALRTHLPLIATRDGKDRVVGVLALAHEQPIRAGQRPAIEDGVKLAAEAVDRR